MLIKNVEQMQEEKLFYCKSINLLKFLTQIHNIQYVSKETKDSKFIWIFLKTSSLDKALTEWADNKKNGTLAFKKS